MQQIEILSLAERLISVYHSGELDKLLTHMTDGQPPSTKLLVKMELNRLMAPCSKSIDLRGKVQGECREYAFDNRQHWLDDVAFNAYHKNMKKFGGYTEGVWEAVNNTRNNFRVMKQQGKLAPKNDQPKDTSFEVEPLKLGYDLKRQENRLKIATQIEIRLPNEQLIHGLSVDLSPSGAKLKVPAAFDYKLGEIIQIYFAELHSTSMVTGLQQGLEYRILGIDEAHDSDAVKFLRVLKLNNSDVIEQVIEEAIQTNTQKARHDNQDKIIRARTRGYEHMYLKHTSNLPLFFSHNELKLALLTENNRPIWQYWHDERNQQALGSLFKPERMAYLAAPGVRGSNNVLYAFKHEHQHKTLFFSMLMPEASQEQRKLFWHIGAKRDSWRAFRLFVFELSDQERQALAQHSSELADHSSALTHCGVLQEIGNSETGHDYLLADKPNLATGALNDFRHPRQVMGNPMGIYFDARSRRKEPRYRFRTPVQVSNGTHSVTGATVDLSKRGLSLQLEAPLAVKANDQVWVDYLELKLYDKTLPLGNTPYQVVRIDPTGRSLQLVIQESVQTIKTIAFFNSIIECNQDKLLKKEEILPSNPLLESLHNILLDKMVSTPFFVEKVASNLKPKVIGVNYPLPAYLSLLAQLSSEQRITLQPIFKGHTNSLLATPMKRIEGAEPQYREIYLSIVKYGTQIQSIESRLLSDFNDTGERIRFIRQGQTMGELYVLRISGVPVFAPITNLLRSDLNELATISPAHAKSLEKEMLAQVGYGEIVDITEEVLIRLELTR